VSLSPIKKIMNYIKIDEETRFKCEDNNYTLELKVPKGDFQGKKGIGFKWEINGYFASLESMLNDWVQNAPSRQKDNKMKVLKDVVKVIQDSEAHIAKLLKK